MPNQFNKGTIFWYLSLAWIFAVLGIAVFSPDLLKGQSGGISLIGNFLFSPVYALFATSALFILGIILFFIFTAFDATVIDTWKRREFSVRWISKMIVSICGFIFLILLLLFSSLPDGIPRL
jgi:hypothetical protein